MRMSKLKKGFTLIELMIVVAIIGILAAVAIPRFADLVTKSTEAATKGTFGSLRSAISIYYGDTEGAYPSDLFVALTTANKYLPAIGNVPALGKYDYPAHTQNAGHKYGAVIGATGVSATLSDGTAIWYNSTTGDAYANCSHFDTKGNRWTAF